MENMERFTPLYAIAYAILDSMENLRFDKEGYFHVLDFYGLFYERNRKHFFLVFPYVIETLVEVWENSKLRTLQFLVLPNFQLYSYYNSPVGGKKQHKLQYLFVFQRSNYLYRELVELSSTLPNVAVAPWRMATIWGGSTLLQMLLKAITDLVKKEEWKWDFFINLSESDYPIK